MSVDPSCVRVLVSDTQNNLLFDWTMNKSIPCSKLYSDIKESVNSSKLGFTLRVQSTSAYLSSNSNMSIFEFGNKNTLCLTLQHLVSDKNGFTFIWAEKGQLQTAPFQIIYQNEPLIDLWKSIKNENKLFRFFYICKEAEYYIQANKVHQLLSSTNEINPLNALAPQNKQFYVFVDTIEADEIIFRQKHIIKQTHRFLAINLRGRKFRIHVNKNTTAKNIRDVYKSEKVFGVQNGEQVQIPDEVNIYNAIDLDMIVI
ncbi:Hypothetical_protein [Hexamita inflata]|uniref:Hypothetical_protein n=1 Tax=Hexamita inflata TaxID=28002 RepID=A0AA86QVZ5_9EUKA|nr:Hypothetical protein HINF_LOCUS49477 [Hexamita inflata]